MNSNILLSTIETLLTSNYLSNKCKLIFNNINSFSRIKKRLLKYLTISINLPITTVLNFG